MKLLELGESQNCGILRKVVDYGVAVESGSRQIIDQIDQALGAAFVISFKKTSRKMAK